MVRTILLGLMIAGVMPVALANPKIQSERENTIAASSIIDNDLLSPCVLMDSSVDCSHKTTASLKTPSLWQIANLLLPGSISDCEKRLGLGSPNQKWYEQQLVEDRDLQVQNLDSQSKISPTVSVKRPPIADNVLISLGELTTPECAFSWRSYLNKKLVASASRSISNSASPRNTSSALVFSPKFPKLSRSSLIVSFPQENSSFVPKNTKLANPAPETQRIASPFGWRKRPYSDRLQFHQGIDYGAPYGSPVVAIGNGIVTKVVSGCADFGNLFCGGQLGNWIEIDHGNGAIGTYGHLKNSSITVKEGIKVRKNQKIARVGSSGWSTGAHLDFRLKVNGEHEDPAKYVMAIDRIKKDRSIK